MARPQTTDAILDQLAKVRAGQVTHSPAPAALPLSPWPETTLNPPGGQPHPEGRGRRQALASGKPPGMIAVLVGLAAVAMGVPLGLQLIGVEIFQSQPDNADGQLVTPIFKVTEHRTLPGHTADVTDLLLLKDGQTLVTSSADETIRLWNLQTGAEIRQLKGHSSVVNALTRTTDQTTLISAGADRRLNFWSLPDGELIHQVEAAHLSPINSLAVSHNGQWLASADSGGVIKLWNLNTLDMIETLSQDGLGTINHVQFTRDDAHLASGGKELLLWDLNHPQDPIALAGHTSFINRLEVSDDNQTLISASADRTVRLWNIANHTLIATLQGHQSYVNDAQVDGPRLWSADEAQTILIWDLHQEVPLRQLQGFKTDIWRFAVQPNGRIVTIGGDRHNVTISIPALESTGN